MTKFSLIAIAALFATSAAHAADPAPAPGKSATAVPVQSVAVPVKVAAPAATTAAAATPTAVAPQKTAGLSQQDKMRECNKQATGKKGAERKAFMKTCLSKKA
jgi:hypothetical protein